MRSTLRLLPLAALLWGSTAYAKNDSIVTLGLGTHTLLSRFQAADTTQPTSTTGGLGFSARLRVLWILGVEMSYQLTNAPSVDVINVPKPVYQLSAVIYLYPGKKASLFLLAGLGSTRVGDLFSVGGATTSYHGGFGLEIGLNPHWMVAVDARVNLPGYAGVMSRVDPAVAAERGTSIIGDYYNFDSFQVNLGVRYYL